MQSREPQLFIIIRLFKMNSVDKDEELKYNVYDKLPTIGNPGESWDMFLVRKLKEYNEYHNSRSLSD